MINKIEEAKEGSQGPNSYSAEALVFSTPDPGPEEPPVVIPEEGNAQQQNTQKARNATDHPERRSDAPHSNDSVQAAASESKLEVTELSKDMFDDEEQDEDEAAAALMLSSLSADGSEKDSVDETDKRSVFVGNVDYSVTPQELQSHFRTCGSINRITVMIDKLTGHPKGFAYVEFEEESSVENAVAMSGTVLHDRALKVTAKRKNVPGFNKRGRGLPPRLRGGVLTGGYNNYRVRGSLRGNLRGGYAPRYRGYNPRRRAAPYTAPA